MTSKSLFPQISFLRPYYVPGSVGIEWQAKKLSPVLLSGGDRRWSHDSRSEGQFHSQVKVL